MYCEAAVCNKYRCCCQSSALVRYNIYDVDNEM